MFKIFDFTLFHKQSESMYFRYPIVVNSLVDHEIIEKIMKNHRSDPDSIFKGNNGMIRFLEIIQCIYPESDIDQNDCILTCDEANTIDYHKFIKKYMSYDNIRNNEDIINQNIIKYFSDLDGQKLDLYDRINKYVCDNFTSLFFGKIYTNEDTSFSECCGKINEYIFTNRMNKVIAMNAYTDNKEIADILLKFRVIIDQIIDDNKKIFDDHNFTLNKRRAFVPILLFAGQETTHVLITYTIFYLSKHCEEIRDAMCECNNDNIDDIVDKIFNYCICESTPAHGTARVLKENIIITANGSNREYNKDSIIGPMPQHLAQKYDKIDDAKRYKNYLPFLYTKANAHSYDKVMPFGSGIHKCPGRQLVQKETKLLIKYLLKNYIIETDTNKIEFVQYMTQKISNKFLSQFTKQYYTH